LTFDNRGISLIPIKNLIQGVNNSATTFFVGIS